MLLMLDWVKRGIFGRDLSKVSLQDFGNVSKLTGALVLMANERGFKLAESFEESASSMVVLLEGDLIHRRWARCLQTVSLGEASLLN